jgi:hypothetical protein
MFLLSGGSSQGPMSIALYQQVLSYLSIRLPPGSICSRLTLGPGVPVPIQATFFDSVVISQRRYWASSRTKNSANSRIAVRSGADIFQVGELLSVLAFTLPDPRYPIVQLGLVRYLKPVPDAFSEESAWSTT